MSVNRPIMNLPKSLSLVFALSALSALPALADVSAGFRVSTLGPGLDFTTSVVPDELTFRINGNYFEYTHDSSLSGVSYHQDLRLETAGLLGNWYPWDNGFFFTAGGYENTSKDVVRARSANGNYNFNGVTYSIGQAGTVSGEAKLGREIAPYGGIGWGNPVGSSATWTFYGELGGLFTGSPKLSLNSTGGSLSGDPTFRNNLEQERQRDQSKISWVDVYPVVALGLAYKF
jgi:hypothetical protein